ncbi:ABC transporter ATP-binding protein [Micromonospora matsumotoense]|uniref:Amino acid/amide ABC transporter ATP-binding protein 2, HAAT family n=1 Tax=Micromonospora matsumotoense TaxID=121616 RepID=A0A1C4XHX7_9ACTN|nr:ABC transporter ATP-binding protein [Micromonospora matsumotoense]SCF07781.1 amino acid/amide ABC transporter ATP-binding protein 2, HAAT family [Micromonospora matsumotoense]
MKLEVRELSAGYGQGQVLHGLDLDLPAGQALALLGRNGVGKTTLVCTLAGLLRPTGGRVLLDGRDVTGWRPDRLARAGVALVPQGRRVWPALTVHEHLALATRHGGRTWPTERVYEVFPRLAQRRRHLAGQLSGGEQQMLVIGRALATDPRLILMDEPSEGLAPIVVDQVAEALRMVVREGLTLLLVEHDLHLALGVTEQAAVMVRGLIVHRCPTPQLRGDLPTMRRLLGVAG